MTDAKPDHANPESKCLCHAAPEALLAEHASLHVAICHLEDVIDDTENGINWGACGEPEHALKTEVLRHSVWILTERMRELSGMIQMRMRSVLVPAHPGKVEAAP